MPPGEAGPEHDRPGGPVDLAPPGTRAFEDQRRLLLELVVDPPPRGEPLHDLAAALGRPAEAIDSAAATLARAGLAERLEGRLRATRAARAFETLWPVRP